MKEYSTSQRLKQIMDIKKMRQVDILHAAEPYCKRFDVKLNKNDLSQYVSGKTLPGQDKLTILGLALGVSEAWLMGYDVSMERSVTPTAETSDGRTKEYIELFELLTPEKQDIIINVIKGLLAGCLSYPAGFRKALKTARPRAAFSIYSSLLLPIDDRVPCPDSFLCKIAIYGIVILSKFMQFRFEKIYYHFRLTSHRDMV